ncbi:D-ribose pyranase [Hafnia paralvei]|uniref:D-ribose pyranase n=1 Tax=Hafnia paralvei TaxID=546367 RepID=A0A4Q9ERY5_9GAMM|nr:D-ribose pyranase [Hafnia paralvei]TBM30364.1 D-ribose pyranase [Hafnia paralvei]
MKKGTLLNSEISYLISRLGHTDAIVVGDAGLPIPDSTQRIDLALTHGVPSFLQVVDVITQEMQVEKAVIAQEMPSNNSEVHEQLLDHLKQLEQHQGNTIAVEYVSHEQFKALSSTSKAVIRSGECSPYANVLLYSGVTF